MERFYGSLLKRDDTAKKSSASLRQQDYLGPSRGNGFGGGSQAWDNEEDNNLPSGVKASEQKLRKMLGTEANPNVATPAFARGTLSDIFGLGGDNGLSPDQIRAHEDYMKRYQEMLNGAASASSTSPMNPLGPAPVNPAAGVSGLPGSSRTVVDPQLGVADPTRLPTVPADITSRVLNQWNPYQVTPAPEPPKPVQPLPTVVEFPRRKF